MDIKSENTHYWADFINLLATWRCRFKAMRFGVKRSYLAVIFFTLSFPLAAADFTGMWEVSRVEFPNNYYGEIKYPKYFELLTENGRLIGFYKDQYDYECKFPLSVTINGGEELLLMVCGTTKSTQSWAPINKVKLIDGELVGSVVTDTQRFVWHAKRVEKVPLTMHTSASPARD